MEGWDQSIDVGAISPSERVQRLRRMEVVAADILLVPGRERSPMTSYDAETNSKPIIIIIIKLIEDQYYSEQFFKDLAEF